MSERDSLKLYVKSCTDSQLLNVYLDEKQRAKNYKDSPIGKTAKLFARVAKEEMEKRGLI